MGRRRAGLVAVCLAALVVAGCSASGGAAGGDRTGGGGRLRVVATTTQVADLAANVGGDRVQVTSLLKPGIDPHDDEPSPADIDAIAHADLVLENGVGLEAWLGDTIDSSGFDGPVVDTSQGLRRRMVGGAADPHIWQNPRNAQVMAATIEGGLAAAEPSAATTFQATWPPTPGSSRPSTARSSGRSTAWPTRSWSPTTTPSAPTSTATGSSSWARSSPASTPRPSCRAATSATWSPRSRRPGPRRSSPRPRCRRGRPRRSAARPGSRSWKARTPCTATPSARAGPTATPTSR
jgi:Zinc-uptake complex component A periplasmic